MLRNLKWLFAFRPDSCAWLWRPLTNFVTVYLLNPGPLLLFLLLLTHMCLGTFDCKLFVFWENYLWDIFEVYDEGVFPDGVSCLLLLGVLPGWWAIRFFDDTILLDPCGYVPLGWESMEACTCGDSSSGMDFSLCSVGCQVSFLGRRPWGLTHFWLSLALKNCCCLVAKLCLTLLQPHGL